MRYAEDGDMPPRTRPMDLSLSAPIKTPTGTLRTLRDAAVWTLSTVPEAAQRCPEWQYVMGLILKAVDDCTDEAIAAATERLRQMVEQRYRMEAPA